MSISLGLRIRSTTAEKVIRKKFPRFNYLIKFNQFLIYFEIGNVNKCWEWEGGRNAKGYGNFGFPEGNTILAHVASYDFFIGNRNHKLQVCHTCDNPPCVNPFHLWQGTNKQNTEDSVRKNRRARISYFGESNGAAKLTKQQASQIRNKFKTTRSYTKLARQFNVSIQTIGRVVTGQNYINNSIRNRMHVLRHLPQSKTARRRSFTQPIA